MLSVCRLCTCYNFCDLQRLAEIVVYDITWLYFQEKASTWLWLPMTTLWTFTTCSVRRGWGPARQPPVTSPTWTGMGQVSQRLVLNPPPPGKARGKDSRCSFVLMISIFGAKTYQRNIGFFLHIHIDLNFLFLVTDCYKAGTCILNLESFEAFNELDYIVWIENQAFFFYRKVANTCM